MAKFDPKKADLNKDGKLSDYEENVGKKRAAAMKMGHSPKKMKHSPMKKYGNGYAMKMGSKEIDSPSAFNMKDMANIQASPMMNHHEIKLDNVDVKGKATDPLAKQKEYKRALRDLGKNVTAQVKRQYSRDSMMSNINTDYSSGKFGNLDVEGQNVGSSKYRFGLGQGSGAAGLPPRVFAHDKKGSKGIKYYLNSSGYTELTNDRKSLTGRKGSSPGLLKELQKYQKLSDSLFAKGKKNIDLKFFGNK
tara:strand:+ start:247 stop:990 length:744 start_codon:yes stop_codon:yes gene_type:complete